MKTMADLISWFQLEYPHLVHQMRNSNHHLTFKDQQILDNEYDGGDCYDNYPENLNPYHLEGTIFEHTMMVCKQAENAPYEVQIAALLHDIGKPSTRSVNPKNGRVSFYNHDAVSAFMSLEILNREELRLSKFQKTLIFNMIALHTQIYKLSVEQLSTIGDTTLLMGLIKLGNADHEGRFHSHEGAEIPSMNDINKHNEVISGFSSVKRGGLPTKEVIVMCGLPGSGKSTYVQKECSDAYRVSRDESVMEVGNEGKPFWEWDDYNTSFKRANQKKVDRHLEGSFKASLMDDGEWDRVVVDMTHMSKKSRRRSLSHFGPEYKKKCVVFLTDLPRLFLQNDQRDGKVIDRRVIERMMRRFYPPTYEEFDEIEYVI